MNSTDALFTRFEGLFKKYLDSKKFLTREEFVFDHARLRKVFYYSWDEGVLRSKNMLMGFLETTYTPSTSEFSISCAALEDHVAESFALALEELRLREHQHSEEEHSLLPEKSRQKSKPGRKANPKVALRRKIVGNHVKEKEDFDDEDKLKLLLQELDREEIPPPEDIDKLPSFTCSWEDLLKKPGRRARVVEVLNRDRWPRKKAT